MRLASVVTPLLFVACQPEPKDFPPLGGGGGGVGGGGGGGGNTDAATDDAILIPLDGRVCLIVDLRKLDLCADTNAADFTVTLGSNTAVTNEDGTFTIERPEGNGLTWHITSSRLVTSVAALGVLHQIPAIRNVDYADFLADNGVILSPGQGSVVVEVLDGTEPLTGATVTSNPQSQFQTRYDGNSAIVWDQDSTGIFGVAWMPGVAAGPAIVTVVPPAGANGSATIAVEDAAITFVTVGL